MNKLIIGLLLMTISGYSAIREETQQFQYVDTVAFKNPVRIGYYDDINITFTSSDFPIALLISTTDGIGIPTGTTAQRPIGDLEYAILRYNSETDHVEYNITGTNWVDLLTLEDSNLASIIASIDAHIVNTDNPHNVETADLGLDGTDGGFQGGIGTTSDSGGAVGKNAITTGGGAIGAGALAGDGGAIGKAAAADDGFSGGAGARSDSNAIQLGLGTNLTLNTLQVYDKQLLDANGIIPMVRMHSDTTTDGELAGVQAELTALSEDFYYFLPDVTWDTGGTTYTLGYTLPSVNLDFLCNKTMVDREYSLGYVENLGSGGSYTYTYASPITITTSFRITVEDARAATDIATKTLSFRNIKYYGVNSSEFTTLSNADIIAMPNTWDARGHSGTVAALDQYIYVSYPSDKGACTSFTLGGFGTDPWPTETRNVTNSYGYVESFIIYHSLYKQTSASISYDLH